MTVADDVANIDLTSPVVVVGHEPVINMQTP